MPLINSSKESKSFCGNFLSTKCLSKVKLDAGSRGPLGQVVGLTNFKDSLFHNFILKNTSFSMILISIPMYKMHKMIQMLVVKAKSVSMLALASTHYVGMAGQSAT